MLLRVMALCCLLGMGLGCSAFPPTVTLRLDDSLRDASVAVHLVAADGSQSERYASTSVTQYWAAGGPSRRADAYRYQTELSAMHPVQVISSGDPIWQRWGESSRARLFIFADVANVSGREGANDPRRASVPLSQAEYKYPKEMTVTVGRGGIRVDPMPEGKSKFFGG